MKKLCTTILMVAFLAVAGIAYGDDLKCEATLSRAQEVPTPAGGTLTGGKLKLKFDKGLTQVGVKLRLEGGSANADRAHLHCDLPGLAGPIAFGIVAPGPADCDAVDLAAGDLKCTLTNADFNNVDCIPVIGRPVNNIAAVFFAAREGLIYVNVHTVENGPGEILGQLLCKD